MSGASIRRNVVSPAVTAIRRRIYVGMGTLRAAVMITRPLVTTTLLIAMVTRRIATARALPIKQT